MYMPDLYRMVLKGEDLYTRGAKYMYHPSCQKTFNMAYTNHLRNKFRNENYVPDTEQDSKGDVHQKAFNVVIEFIKDQVLGKNEIVQLKVLRLLYIQTLEANGFPNPEFRADKLKNRLENHEINDLIAFAKICPKSKGCITYNLVYSACVSVEEAVTYAALLWQKEVSDKSEISCKRAKCVCHFHWHQWNIMMSYLTYLLAGWGFMHKIWPGRRAHWVKYKNINNLDLDGISLALFCQSRAVCIQPWIWR